MSKVQEYLRKKKIKELGLPMMYVVKSTPDGVGKPVERQVVEIKPNYNFVTYSDGKMVLLSKYVMEDDFPYEIDIEENNISASNSGYGSGFGDLWGWTYYCTLSKEDAEQYYINEWERVKDKYYYKIDE